MAETPTNINTEEAPKRKETIIKKVREKIGSLVSEMKGKIGEKLTKKPEEPKEDKDDGFDPNNLPKYIQDIDNGVDPN